MSTVIGPGIWGPLERAAFGSEGTGTGIRILHYMHSRHVGITPDLAKQLVPWIDQPALSFSAAAGNFWRALTDRLQRAVDEPGRHRQRRSVGVSLGQFPAYAVTRLVLPLVHLATVKIGRNFLFGDAGHCESAQMAAAYPIYEADLKIQLARMLSVDNAESASLALFFEEHAQVLAGLSRRHAAPDLETSLPVSDAVACPLLLRLKPTTENVAARSRRDLLPRRHATLRTGRKPRQSGSEGITLSANPADISDMIPSEYFWLSAESTAVWVDRILNGGFFIRHRPPYRLHERDVLIVGLMPKAPGAALTAKIVRTIWFESVARFAKALVEHGLIKTTFLWLEESGPGILKYHAASLDDLPAGGSMHMAAAQFRRLFLKQLSWLPGFADRTVCFAPLLEAESGVTGLDRCTRWIRRAFEHGMRRTTHGHQNAPSTAGDYRMVQIMTMLPAEVAADHRPAQLLARIISSVGIGAESGRRFDLLTVPAVLADATEWQVCSADARIAPEESLVFDGGFGAPGSLNRVAGKLADHWERRLLEGLFGE